MPEPVHVAYQLAYGPIQGLMADMRERQSPTFYGPWRLKSLTILRAGGWVELPMQVQVLGDDEGS